MNGERGTRNDNDNDDENLATSTKLTDKSKPRCKRFTAATKERLTVLSTLTEAQLL
jgi:hypothetical protein